MTTRVQKWGNSLALRIPKPLAIEAGLKNDSPVELSLQEGRLVITPAVQSAVSLDELLAKVTRKNLHGEVDAGPAAGREIW